MCFTKKVNKRVDETNEKLETLSKKVTTNSSAISQLKSTTVQTASNVGDGTAKIFAAKVGTDLKFKSFKGIDGAVIQETADTILIGISANPGGITQSYVDASLLQRDNDISKRVTSEELATALQDYIPEVDLVNYGFATQLYVQDLISQIPVSNVTKDYVDQGLLTKADNTTLESNYATKNYVNEAISNIPQGDVTKQYVDDALKLKTDKSYVDASLSKRDTVISLKADKTYVDQQLTLIVKPDVTKSYVDGSLGKRDTAISLKADKTYVDEKFINDNSTGFIYYEFESGPITANTSKQLVHGKNMVGKYFVNARNINDTNNVTVQLLRISLTNAANAVEIKSPVDISNLIIQVMGKARL